MPTLADIRKQYPQYADVPDDKLATALHAKFYADVPVEKFNAAIGYKPALRAQTASAPAPTPAQLALRDAQRVAHGSYGWAGVLANGATLHADDLLNAGLMAGMTGVGNLVTRATGGHPQYGMGDMFNAYRQAQTDEAAKHPNREFAGGLLGGAFIPGLGKGAEAVNGALQTIKNPITRALASAAAGAATGAPLGAINGALTAAPGQEMQGAQNGAMVGAVTGGLAPGAAYVGGKVVQGGLHAAKAGYRFANKATGGQLLDATKVAAQRLAEAMKADKVDPDTARQIMGQWLKTGVTPAMLDVVPQGGRTQALIRGAAMSGDARAVARKYAMQTAADTQDNALALTRKLTPGNKQTAAQHQAQLEGVRSTAADADYLKPYAEQVPTQPVMPAITGPEGEKALSTAFLNASANKTTPEIAARIPELEAMQSGAIAPTDPLMNSQPVPTASVGALDQVKIALQRHAADLAENSQMLRAKGYGDLADLVDQHLANNSDLYAQARDNYAANSRPIDAVQLGESAALPGAVPGDYADSLSALSPNALPSTQPDALRSAQVGLRAGLEQRIGAKSDEATGVLNTLSSGANPTDILRSTFGQNAADNYQSGLGNLVTKLQNARKIDQSSGSDSAGRLVDYAEQNAIPKKMSFEPLAIVSHLWDKIQSGATLTDAEKQAITQFGVMPAQQVLPTIKTTTSMPAQVDDWLTQHLSQIAGRGGLLGASTFSNQSSQ